MEKRVLWFFVVALLAVDIVLLAERSQSGKRFRDLQRASAAAMLKMEYAAEEEALLTKTAAVPPAFPRVESAEDGDAVQFILLASVDNCTNCIENEVAKLNELVVAGLSNISGVQGFFVDAERLRMAETFIKHLSPTPVFPVSVRNALSQLPDATTPLVLVIRSRDGKILDAHKPIPEDLTKRDAFYARWAAALGMS
jgi:hypothetical protein